ncbi:uroporphyrinogen-III C-methyltransferase [Dyadobacter sediminis]|uniref:uroporphyrinogen-III C-methyltransferase n=1 Tax=Dyadobacter sediminis TaxID=1493691 RepID=A0A5R9KC63_9BACT|nr:uroporphyrinogen-III C-methyltransferase [Dyadobacter sediminis]TLU92433.1 uroporphyrinogen-III C-methyltransferase [Dyadobacter sediminis]GGB94504.1 uroporphyrinogen-III C-methyltransferase [Dyadobacter sediminis]
MEAKLTLVGAGPGNGDLITLRGINALKNADVVLYDELANAALLDFAPAHALKMYVGKKAGNASFSQQEINGLIVRLARKRGHVVRLKGGDSFVFGRGHEEMEYARDYDIKVEVVPGVSSCIAVPASVEIPVTRRGVSESFWVITGTTQNGELSEDLKLAAQSKATVVVLMGMNKLTEICSLYKRFGRGHLPVAIIQNGTRPDQKSVIGQVWEMPRLALEHHIGTPAIIILGEVVALHPEYTTEYLHAMQHVGC